MVVSSTVLVPWGSCLILLKCNVLVLTDMTQLEQKWGQKVHKIHQKIDKNFLI